MATASPVFPNPPVAPTLSPSPSPALTPSTNATVSVITNLGIGAGIFLFVLVLYDVMRYFFPGHVYYRSVAARNPANNDYDGTPLFSPQPPSPYPLAWIMHAINYSEASILRTHGLDAAMYLRFLATQAKIFLALSLTSSIILIPTYVTASPTASSPPTGIEAATLANVPHRSNRLWLTLVCELIVVTVILVSLFYDIKFYTRLRRNFRADIFRNPSNFAILVMDIPTDDRTEAAIFNQFDKIFPRQVCAVHPVRDAHHLLSLKTRYVSVVNRRERAEQSVFAPKPSSAVPSPESTLNPPNPTAPHPNPTSSPPPQLTLPYSRASLPPSYSLNLPPTDDPTYPEVLAEVPENIRRVSLPTRPKPSMLTVRPFVRSNSVNSSPSKPMTGPSPRLRALMRPDSSLIHDYQRQENNALEVVNDVERDIDRSAPITHAAFVVFRSRVAATCAVSAPIFATTSKYDISRAPEPRAINWDRINISRYTTMLRRYTTFGVLTALTLLWAFPSSFIQGLGNLETLGTTLKDRMPWVKRFVENNPSIARFLEGILPPLLLFLVLLVVPQIVRFIIRFERIPNNVEAEARVRNFLFFFYAMSNFIYQVALGSFLDRLPEILESPGSLLTFLSESVPTQATFLMKYVVINSFLGSAFGMLNIGRLLIRPFVMWRAKTERDVIRGDRSFADYPFTKMYALCMMIFLISLVYSTIAPLMTVVATMYFTIAYICTKQFILYSHRPLFEGGGFLYRDAWTGLLIALYVHQLSMIGIFSLMRATTQGALAISFLIVSIWFTLYCRGRFLSQVENGALIDQCDEDRTLLDLEKGVVNEIPKHFSNMYIHPGLKPVEAIEDTEVNPITASLGEDILVQTEAFT